MKIIVFGGSGFLGSHVADYLESEGHEVVLFDVKPSLFASPTQKMLVEDILDLEKVHSCMQGVDAIYHFAGLADLDHATTRPAETVQLNIVGTVNLLEAAVKAGIKRFIFGSTIYVYSGLGGFYRCSKQACELYIEEYQKAYGLDFTILRYGSLYGPRAGATNSIRRYLQEGLQSQRIAYPGTGNEVREYIHVKDAAKLSVDILAQEYKNQHIIITGHHPMKAGEMLAMIEEILDQKVTINFAHNTSQSHYNITPYLFIPKIGKKLVSNCYTDMGQGFLECLHEISDENNHSADNL